MAHFESLWDARYRNRVLALSVIFVLAVAVADWLTEPYISLSFLYMIPIVLAASFLPRWGIAILALACGFLSFFFSGLGRSGEIIRFVFETFALGGSGLFVAELTRNRRLTQHSQERMRVLVETSPAAIVTVDERGLIEVANRAAIELIAPRDDVLVGLPIAAYLPELHHALRREEGPQFRTSMQCLVHRDNGESFLVQVWFSTYREGNSPKLAAIIGEVSDQEERSVPDGGEKPALNARETGVLRLLVQGLANKEIASRLDISESAVKNTMQQLFAKTGVRTRGQLVRVALEQYRELL